LRTVYHRDFTFLILIGLVAGLTSVDFVFLRSKVNVTKVTFVKILLLLIFLRTIYHRAFMCDVLSEDKSPIDLGFTRSKGKVTKVTFVKNNVNMIFCLILY